MLSSSEVAGSENVRARYARNPEIAEHARNIPGQSLRTEPLAKDLDKDLLLAGWGLIRYDDAKVKRDVDTDSGFLGVWAPKVDIPTDSKTKRAELDKDLLLAGWGQIRYDDAKVKRDAIESNLFGWLIAVADYDGEDANLIAKRDTLESNLFGWLISIADYSGEDTNLIAKRDAIESNLFGWLIAVADYDGEDDNLIAKRDTLESNLFGWLIGIADYDGEVAVEAA
ncbi:uncharacterized protein PV07_02400 [Cladophialophora immunda]|uniref:Uncharacterized protein n=1 Tax=Cladophialophora immunda TaxID=569365 RepID=A0A0D2CXA8_9EURO|nr:uncharacterized protein PV07_02400 [Cladophialophora immunda]KIW35718.1 hypothetical protein PV07_02400 [Cladophialophora immunda]OQV05020.1 hypothetical protein CLAIMM_09823 isoform 1 [Cladophialophora immunda]